ncbi:MAG: SEC-C domain-containing protein [Deltaproteobacteria bacterium]|nr:SEC-C domain-containing protein [Deltaproteobacteria bacterium]
MEPRSIETGRESPEHFLGELDEHRPSLAAQVRSGLPDLSVATAPLLQVLRTELDEPCGDDAVVAAARLAGAWRRSEAVEPLVALLESVESEAYLYSAAIFALGDIGAAAVEPLLAAWPRADDDAADAIADALVQTGVKDDRILELLLGTLDRSHALGSTLLGQYGDRRARPALSRAVDGIEVDPTSPIRNITVYDLEDSIHLLGGALTQAQSEKVSRARELSDTLRRVLGGRGVLEPARRQERPGRNAPCWCGSGKKYKRCHLDAGDQGI